jgi:hypothetical protein
MKRSRIRRKSKTPRKWIDEDARREYMRLHPADELEIHLDGESWHRLLLTDFRIQLDPHHILHEGGVRWDLPQNLLAVTRRAHDYVHHVDAIGGGIACIYAKLHGKTKTSRERIRMVWRSKYGRDAIGNVSNQLENGVVPEWAQPLAMILMEMF